MSLNPTAMAWKLLPLRRLFRLPKAVSSSYSYTLTPFSYLLEPSGIIGRSAASRRFFCCERPQGPTAIDYSLADSTIHHLQDKFEEYGDNVHVDGFNIDYGNEVLTLELGEMGTYVLNKQTPNRQIWLSSPLSGPARFDWDSAAQAWVYRRTKANLLQVLESEVKQLCGEPINLS